MNYGSGNYEKVLTADFGKSKRVEDKLRRLSEILISNPTLWTGVVAVGWTRMLESSDFPVLPDRILRVGFSPHEWFLAIRKASTELSSSIIKVCLKNDEIKQEEICEILGIGNIELKKHIDKNLVDRIKEVLRWDEVLTRLDIVGVKILAFLWFADYLTVLEGILYPEAEVEVQKKAVEFLQRLMNEDKESMIQRIEKMVNLIGDIKERIGTAVIEIADWEEIIRFPW